MYNDMEIPGVRVYRCRHPGACMGTGTYFTIPDTFVSSVEHPFPTRYLCEFCKKFIPVLDRNAQTLLNTTLK